MSIPKSALVILFFTLALSPKVYSQSVDSILNIPIIDMRALKPVQASVAAIKNSRNDVVVVLIRGGSDDLIHKTKAQLSALVHNGYNRLGVILCGLNPGEKGPVIGIVSNGTAYAAIKSAKPDTETAWKVYNLVRDAYEDDILPKLGNANQRNR